MRVRSGTVLAWSLYELGATSFAMNLLSLHLPLDIAGRVPRGSEKFSLAFGLSMAVVAVVAPFLGASEQRDQIALYKLLSGVLLFPIMLAVWTAASWGLGGAAWGTLSLLVLPFAGVLSLVYLEHADWRERQARELLALVVAPGAIARLKAERDALVAECDRLAGTFTGASDNPAR